MGTTVPLTRLPASPGAPSSPSRPTSPWVEEEMGDMGHQQPSHMAGTGDKGLLPAWGGDRATRHCGTLGMDTKAMMQSWHIKGRSPVTPQGHLSWDRGSPVGLRAELGILASPSPKNQLRQPKIISGLCVCQTWMCSCLYSGEKQVHLRSFPLDHSRVDQARLSHPCPMASPPQVPPAEDYFKGTFSPLRPFRPFGPACPGDP